MEEEHSTSSSCSCKMCWKCAIISGFIATLVLTVVAAIFGINQMKSLGMMLLDPDASEVAMYVAGGILHFAIGVIYGILYALIIVPMTFLNRFLKAVIWGTILTAIAYFAVPYMPKVIATVIKGESHMADNPCNPCNPCNAYQIEAYNPCNPCAWKSAKIHAILMSWVFHLIYAFALALLYRRKG